MTQAEQYIRMFRDNPASLLVNAIICSCVVALFLAIAQNFANAPSNTSVKREQKSIVETGSMTLFFLAFYLLIRFRVGVVTIPAVPFRWAMVLIGLSLVILGTFVNVRGRKDLGSNWANHVRIYNSQFLASRGMYRFVRHPLYASIIWMFTGAAFVYANAAALAANFFVFVPFMVYRARQEEILLEKELTGYAEYKKNTGMFLPKFFMRKKND